jgi:O-antigen/teichoic acid export membrane protein
MQSLALANKLVRGSTLRVLNLIIQITVSFFLMPFMIHSLGDRMYGLWIFIGTFIGFYGLLDLGLSSSVGRHISGAIGAKKLDECNRIFNTSIILYSALACVVILITIVIALLAPIFFKKPEEADLFWKVVLILGINLAIDFPIRAFGGILTAQLRFDLISTVEMISLVLRTILVVVVLNAGYGILALTWVTVLSGIPEKILSIYLSMRNFPSLKFNKKNWELKTAKTLFTYGIFTLIAQLGDILRFKLDHLVITVFVGLAAVTHFSIASSLVTYFTNFVLAATGVLLPVFSQLEGVGDNEQIKKVFFFSSRISICISSFIGYGMIALGKPFIDHWMGSSYVDAYPCLVLLVLGSVFTLWQTSSVNLLYGISKNKYYAILNSIEGAGNLFLSLVLVRYWGIIGVAVGTFIPMVIIRLFILPLYVCRIISIPFVEYVRITARTVGMNCLALAIPLLISLFFATSNYWVLATIGLVSFCIYSVTIWILEFDLKEKFLIQKAIMPSFLNS